MIKHCIWSTLFNGNKYYSKQNINDTGVLNEENPHLVLMISEKIGFISCHINTNRVVTG